MTGDGAVTDGVVAVVTGAARGIGEAVTRALTGAGARVAALDIDTERVRRVAAGLGTAVPYTCQVADSAAVDDVIARVETDLGPIGLLVNVAGVLCSGPAVTIDDDDWARTFAVNAGGVLHLCRAVARRMIPRRSGAIVTVGSNAAGVPRMNMAAYAASKAAAAQFTKCLGLELAPYGIRCNVVSPGSTDTPMQRALWTGGHDARTVIDGSPSTFRVGIPLGRLAAPEDIADAVLFLASDRARHITMQDLYVDGGATLRS